jgi:hypothetical protein
MNGACPRGNRSSRWGCPRLSKTFRALSGLR